MEWKTDSDIEDVDNEEYLPFAKKKSARLLERTETPFILMGAVLLVLIVFFIFFLPKTQKVDPLALKSIESRLSDIEMRIANLEEIKEHDGQAVNQSQESENSLNTVEYQQLVKWIKSNAEIISQTIKKLDALEKDVRGTKGKPPVVASMPKPMLQPPPAPKPEPAAKSTSKPKPETQPIPKVEVKPEPKPEPTPQIKPKAAEAEPAPKIVAQTPKDAPETIKMTYHKVEKGETLYRISRNYKTTVKKIQELNNMKDSLLIYPGQELIVNMEKQ